MNLFLFCKKEENMLNILLQLEHFSHFSFLSIRILFAMSSQSCVRPKNLSLKNSKNYNKKKKCVHQSDLDISANHRFCKRQHFLGSSTQSGSTQSSHSFQGVHRQTLEHKHTSAAASRVCVCARVCIYK